MKVAKGLKAIYKRLSSYNRRKLREANCKKERRRV